MSNKEQMAPHPNSKKSALTLAIENNPCGVCRRNGYPTCKCGKGSAASGDVESPQEDSNSLVSKQAANLSNQEAAQKFGEAKNNFATQLSTDKIINYEASFFAIESDRVRGNLTFRIKPGLSTKEIEIARKFLKVVKAEFDDFKNQLAEQGISTTNFTANLTDNALAIHIPNPKYYNAFIKHLDNKNLLPIPNSERLEKMGELHSDKRQKHSSPTPFATRLERKK